mmetsp:Transcript_95287/g.188854  ORF Transcript_95287/g.188854 Transcript_95287/m.188854 type:complete len:257 (+) Transcript_95287:53-823(+)
MAFPKPQEQLRDDFCDCETDGCCCAQPLVAQNGATNLSKHQETGPIKGWQKHCHSRHRCPLILGIGAMAAVLGTIAVSRHIIYHRSGHQAVKLWMPTASFQRINYGSCVDIGWLPIANQSDCEQAASDLGLKDTSARVTNELHRPDGCYFLYNERYGTGSLWLSTNERNANHGATASFAWVRQPICKAQKIVIPTTVTTTTTSLTSSTVSTSTMTTMTTTANAAAILQSVASEIASTHTAPDDGKTIAQVLGSGAN